MWDYNYKQMVNTLTQVGKMEHFKITANEPDTYSNVIEN